MAHFKVDLTIIRFVLLVLFAVSPPSSASHFFCTWPVLPAVSIVEKFGYPLLLPSINTFRLGCMAAGEALNVQRMKVPFLFKKRRQTLTLSIIGIPRSGLVYFLLCGFVRNGRNLSFGCMANLGVKSGSCVM